MSKRIWLAVALICVALGANVAELRAGTLEDVRKSGVFRIGYRDNTPPFSFVDEAGNASGYSVELCRRIAAAVKESLGLKKLETQFVPVDMESRFKAVAGGKVDIYCASTTITLSRLETVDFTLMTFMTGGGVISLAQTGIRAISDLDGRSVAVIKETTTETGLAKYLEATLIDASVKPVDSIDIAMEMLDKGEVDAVADDQIVLIGQAVESGRPASYAIAEDLYSFEPYGLVVRRNDADFRLVANRALAKLYRTGQYTQLFDKWFGRAGVRPSPILGAMFQIQALPE